MQLATRLCALVFLGFIGGSARAQEWTRFRGPNGSGINETTHVPAVWSAQDYRWKMKLPGGGHSSPVLWGGRLFITCADDSTADRSVLGIAAADGKIVWRADFPSHVFHQHQDNSYASSTPAVDADRVYVCWNTPEEFTLTALDHDGKQLWKTDLGPFISQHGGGNSPIVVGDVVLLGDDQEGRESFLFGIDSATGKILWKLHRNSKSFSASTPILLTSPDVSPLAVFTSKGEGVTAIDPQTGKVQWSLPSLFNSRTVSSPVAGDGLIFATCGEGTGGHVLVAARPPTSGAAAGVAYKLTTAAPYVPTPLYRNDLLFILTDTGMLSCCRASTGEVVWQQRIGGSYYSSPVCAAGTLFCVSKKGTVTALAASDRFQLLGRTELGEKCHSTPAIAYGCLFARTYTQLVCVNGATDVKK
jgi:outer membrane protein assembly factor BamB